MFFVINNFTRAIIASSVIAGGTIAFPVSAQEVNIYSHRQPELIQPLIDAFTNETGVKVNIAFVAQGMAERLKAEGKRSPADVVLTVDIARLAQLVDADVLQPVVSHTLTKNIPPSLRDSNNQWFGLTSRARVIYASKDRVEDGEVTTYEDLASDKWKGRICSRSGLSDYNIALISAYIAHHGEDNAKQWLAGVKSNLARKPEGGDRDQVKAIAAGICDIAIGNTYYIGQMLADPKQRPMAEQVKIIYPIFEDNGTHLNVSGVALTKAAPNKDTAIQFIEWLSSDKAQQIYAETNNEFPVKDSVPRSALVTSWGEFIPDTLGLSEVSKGRERAVEIVEEVNFDG